MAEKKKNPARVRAGRKAARTRKRNTPARTRTTARKRSSAPARRRRPRRKSMTEGIAENFDVSKKGSSINLAVQGALAGGAAYFVTRNMPDPKQKQMVYLLGLAAAVAMKKGGMAAGIAGVAILDFLMRQTPMAEGIPRDASFFDPAMLNEGEPLVLDWDGTPMMSEAEYDLSQGGFDLSQGPSIYPSYFPPTY